VKPSRGSDFVLQLLRSWQQRCDIVWEFGFWAIALKDIAALRTVSNEIEFYVDIDKPPTGKRMLHFVEVVLVNGKELKFIVEEDGTVKEN